MSTSDAMENGYEGDIEDNFEFYDEPLDRSVWGWDESDKPCSECGGLLMIRSSEHDGIFEIEESCNNCGYYDIYYE